MLGLKLPTDPRWADLAAISVQAILTDHAYCEQKAAISMISLIQSYPEEIRVVDELAPVVTEEWGHFRAVLAMLKKEDYFLDHRGGMIMSINLKHLSVMGATVIAN